jgi:hypothetical protein
MPYSPPTPSPAEHSGRAIVRELFEFVLIPLAIMLSPRSIRARVLHRLVTRTSAYRLDAWLAIRGIQGRPQSASLVSPAFYDSYRLQRALCNADLLHAAVFKRDWLPETRRGNWPDGSAPSLIVSFHFGSGIHLLHDLTQHSRPTHFLQASPNAANSWHRPVRTFMGRVGEWASRRRTAAPVIYVGGAYSKMAEGFQAQHNVAALVDVPQQHDHKGVAVAFMDAQAVFPLGALRAALAANAQVVVFHSAIANDGSRRHTTIETLSDHQTPEALLAAVIAILDRAITENPTAWQMWQHLADFFPSPSHSSTVK